METVGSKVRSTSRGLLTSWYVGLQGGGLDVVVRQRRGSGRRLSAGRGARCATTQQHCYRTHKRKA
eukprot:CAMPEP_0198341340 /NCGR_PEP_ID=MMETSP1450-20131203/47395_1 /TAXON_ID=753684 ORGANISM="Madagascaria erythrocladiodes, Strain CCMP3234" /NCGR_SAMPLE_ID=MMETSP1450 /ASSEMBLY_ACC=CAM_ASM_001115 /LENGTH=65 /DNA_ID=CAMNT_0044046361 /DNA_START=36 /DNA_END=233 /DNA_ORIENTATION=+